MSLFALATNETAFLKMGLLGFQGSGKTYTAAQVAVGLRQHIGIDGPVYFLDTETGSDWVLPLFAGAGIELRVSRSRAFADLAPAIAEVQSSGGILIIDSITHFWNELIDSFLRTRRLKEVKLWHWGPIKKDWRSGFSEPFVNSPCHIICCGRAGYDFADVEEEDGHRSSIKAGTKMRAEGEFGFEPSLVVEMERVKLPGVSGLVVHRATVLKDRNCGPDSIDGQRFDNPGFSAFLPHVRYLALGGAHRGVDTERSSDTLTAPEGDGWTETRRKAAIIIDEIRGELEMAYPGTGKMEKQYKAAITKRVFGTYSDEKLAALSPFDLTTGRAFVRDIIKADGGAAEVLEKVRQDAEAGGSFPGLVYATEESKEDTL